jgi:hypothetical protein
MEFLIAKPLRWSSQSTFSIFIFLWNCTNMFSRYYNTYQQPTLRYFCSSLDEIWTHTIDTLQHHSLSLTSSALDHSTTSIYINNIRPRLYCCRFLAFTLYESGTRRRAWICCMCTYTSVSPPWNVQCVCLRSVSWVHCCLCLECPF